ncbi:outer membrane protein transport protein [Acinetobacter soli]|uniref:OmpP1/FadL family transporter n=1 Tax=Acinetobacter soli TaxID=487316 RepID=UPI0012506511|nr:outer membrane protein transport protein [Acinetobacter soli]MBV6551408.1 outer membrane protein transport protein [Acinetobacter soli]MEB4801020.1 outer membrane protein transport protein [Acinetobacter soli]WEH92240.1 outer membrane protein transport protein [Acinetobacter soli]WEH98601.1 outer membrane protein transport protein [Acinetobacter soli]WEI00802.1 outer membrane protein transport protein [Acinetobacter soli]
MKLKHLSTAVLLASLPLTGAFAAALDRSGQSMSAFLQPGNYFEAGLSILDPDVSGKEAGSSTTRRDVGDMAEDYYFPSAALKLQLTDHFSFGLLYDQPFGAKAEYSGNNVFVASPSDPVLGGLPITTSTLGGVTGNTKVEVDSQNISMVLGFQPNQNWNFYAGPVYQTVKGNVNLRGRAYSLYNGYDANIKETDGVGWLAGLAYQIPEIALKASLTYRSEIDHKVNINESVGLADALSSLSPAQLGGLLALLGPSASTLGPVIQNTLIANAQNGKTTITTPQSVNLDFQTGIMANTVAFANVRWVNWKDFSIQPYKFGKVSEAVGPLIGRPNGFNLVEYSDDQWSANVGVGRKLNEQWAGNVSVGWDSGAGNPVTTLGPTEGYWNVGLGVQYSPQPNYFIAGGVKYFWLGDAKAQTGAQAGGSDYVAEFSDNHAIAYGMKIGYKF